MVRLKNNKLFQIGIIIKLCLIVYLTPSPYTIGGLFVPFLENIEGLFSNPYSFAPNANAFPYPALMLYIFVIAKYILFFLPTVISMKLVILLADVCVLFILLKWIQNRKKEVLYLYWLSPLAIYINYMHGQLDIIPILLLMLCIYYIFKNKYILGMIFLGLSIAAKTSMVLALPFVIIFCFFRKKTLINTIQYLITVFGVFVVINLPFLWDSAFYSMVFNNSAQHKLFDVVLTYKMGGGVHENYLYLAIFFYLVVLFQSIYLKLKTYDIFLLFISFAFGIILIFVNPVPGWFYWILPFWVYFFAQSSVRSQVFFLTMQVSLLAYFFIMPSSDYLLILPYNIKELIGYSSLYEFLINLNIADKNYIDILVNIFFTLSIFTLVINVFYIYKRGIESYTKYKIISKPILIGIGGNSGVGKSRIANALTSLFGSSNLVNIKGDDVHKWERGHKNWDSYTHLDPKANDLYYDYNQLLTLKNGKNIKRRHYDHSTGKFIHDVTIKSSSIILYDGLHPYYIKQMRNIFDLKIFVSPDPMLAKYWKVKRDVIERGYSLEKVLAQIETRMNDYQAYIKPQEQVADIVVSVKPITEITNDNLLDTVPETMLSIKVCNSIYLEPFVDKLNKIKSIKVEYKYIDFDFQELNIYGQAEAEEIKQIGNLFSIDSFGFSEPVYKNENAGIIQLLVLYYIFEVLDDTKS